MTEKNSGNHNTEDEQEPMKPSSWDKLLESPEVTRSVSEIPKLLVDLIKANIEAKRSLNESQLGTRASSIKERTKWTLAWTAAVILIIVAPVTWMSITGTIYSDAVSFLFGTIIGAAFTFLRNFFPGGN